MKSIIRIPTTQYGYLEFEFEGTPEEAIEEHNRILKLYAGGGGLDVKSFNIFMDDYLSGKMEGLGELYHAMSPYQQEVVQIIKRSLKRIKSKMEPEIE